ncbi:MAG: 6,7-dimethyl-8-ribityllumazine synthase [Phycisphaerales bacterium]
MPPPDTTARSLSSPADAPPIPRIAVVVARYNASITDRLLEGATQEYARRGGGPTGLAVLDAPGAFEVPAIAAAAARSGKFGAIVALGCIIRGETRHDRYLAQSVTDALMSIAVGTGVAVGLGVLTVENARQARDRAGGKKGNKGAEAMAAAIDAAAAIARARGGEGSATTPIAPRADKADAADRRRGR